MLLGKCIDPKGNKEISINEKLMTILSHAHQRFIISLYISSVKLTFCDVKKVRPSLETNGILHTSIWMFYAH